MPKHRHPPCEVPSRRAHRLVDLLVVWLFVAANMLESDQRRHKPQDQQHCGQTVNTTLTAARSSNESHDEGHTQHPVPMSRPGRAGTVPKLLSSACSPLHTQHIAALAAGCCMHPKNLLCQTRLQDQLAAGSSRICTPFDAPQARHNDIMPSNCGSFVGTNAHT